MVSYGQMSFQNLAIASAESDLGDSVLGGFAPSVKKYPKITK